MRFNYMMKKLRVKDVCIIVAVFLLISGLHAYLMLSDDGSYLQTPEQIYIMEAGILSSYLDFAAGEDVVFAYDFDAPAYEILRNDYGIEEIAGDGGELERALRLMDEFSPRLTHQSSFTAEVEISALPLLEYSLDHKNQGINCRCKAQILNEMCLALGIYARKVWLMPLSVYDGDCHVVNEIWDSGLQKWVMMDITNDRYWVDEKGSPLSALEIRQKGAMQEFCTPVSPGDDLSALQRLRKKHMSDFIYIMKNMVYMRYLDCYAVGEDARVYTLRPESLNTEGSDFIAPEAVLKPPATVQ